MNVYIFQAALYCEGCSQTIQGNMQKPQGEDGQDYDSNDYPVGPYPDGGGESDSPAHCNSCGTFLENPLTQDGQEYVKTYCRKSRSKYAKEYRKFYAYLWRG